VDGTEWTIFLAYGLAVALSIVVAVALVLSTRSRTAPDTHRLAEFEKRWLAIVAAILVALLAATIWFTPYGSTTPSDAQVVKVTARQFFWDIAPARVSVGRPVAFETRSVDVNHDFAIYRGRKFIAQIQVVPGATSTLIHTFREPGTYSVLCLEYCGVNHHGMIATFQVTK
jgi:cytochrome c oxidase subunit 2